MSHLVTGRGDARAPDAAAYFADWFQEYSKVVFVATFGIQHGHSLTMSAVKGLYQLRNGVSAAVACPVAL